MLQLWCNSWICGTFQHIPRPASTIVFSSAVRRPDYMPLLFEWYKHIGILAIGFSPASVNSLPH